jgi:hypothetical protein
MSKLFSTGRLRTFFTVLVCLVAATAAVRAEDRFALALGPHDVLSVFGPKGEKGPVLTPNSVGIAVTVAGIPFQISYGHDSAEQLTVLVTPDLGNPQELHFNIAGRAIDMSRNAVVTITFSRNGHSITVDPGMVGRVEVNEQRLGHRPMEFFAH